MTGRFAKHLRRSPLRQDSVIRNAKLRLENLESRTMLASDLVISEFLTKNDHSIRDEDSDRPDWIEIHNTTAAPLNLSGWYLSDNAGNPGKWAFPNQTLAPGAYEIVFASDKNRIGSELHTNFKLSSSSSFLGLAHDTSTPQGVVPTFVQQFGNYPAQVADVSYGPTQHTITTPLLSSGAAGKLLVPTADIGTGWSAEVADDSTWTNITTGVGFDTTAPAGLYAAYTNAAGSVGTQSYAGSMGQDFTVVRAVTVTDLGVFDSASDGIKRLLTSQLWQRNGNTGVKLAELEFSPDSQGTLINGNRFKPLATSIVLQPGTYSIVAYGYGGSAAQPATYEPNGNEATGGPLAASKTKDTGGGAISFNSTRFSATAGPFPTTTTAISSFYFSAATFRFAPSLFTDQIASNVQAAMAGVNATAYLRIPFTGAALEPDDTLKLNAKYDDGFVAYLNGQEVARRNAPESTSWNSAATAARTNDVAVIYETIDITPFKSSLHVGSNVLAIQALNQTTGDGDFLIVPQIVFEHVATSNFYFVTPTPQAANGNGVADLGPVVTDVTHSPNVPQDNQNLLISAHVMPALNGLASVTLHYRVMFGTETIVSMVDNGTGGDLYAGDQLYSATIPASAAGPGQMIRWYVRATDLDGTVMRVPQYASSTDSEQYQGTVVADPSVVSDVPVLHRFLETPGAADTAAGTRGAVFYLGEFYDNVQWDIHGQSTQGFPKKAFDVGFPKDHHFLYEIGAGRVANFNLLTNYADKTKERNTLGYEVFKNAGSPYHVSFPVRVQQNGVFYSLADYVENGDEDFLQRLGLDDNGALYKMYNSFESSTSNVEKKTRETEDNSDLQALINGAQLSGAALKQYMFDNVNLPEAANYLAGMVVASHGDCCHKNYYAYHDNDGTGEWQFFPWDVDLTFGHNWTPDVNYFNETVFTTNPPFVGNGNVVFTALFNIPAFREMYVRRLRTLMDEQLQPPGTPAADLKFEKRMDELLAQVGPTAALDYAAWPNWGTPKTMAQAVAELKTVYLPGRRNYLYNTQTVGNGGEIPAAQVDLASLPLAQRKVVFGTIEFTPTSGNQDQEYIQLVNNNTFAVDVSGWQVSGGVEMTLAPGTVIPALSSLYLTPDVVAFRARTTGPKGGQGLFVQGGWSGHLSAFGESLTLTDQNDAQIASTTYVGNPSAAQQFLKITEVMYNPVTPSAGSPYTADDFEFVEFANTGAQPLTLTGVRFSSGISFTFGNFTLPAGQRAVVVKNSAAFTARYGAGINIAGEFEVGSVLSNGGEHIELDDPLTGTIVEFDYVDADAWPERADGRGSSLEVVNTGGDYASPTNWRASALYNGSPGAVGVAPVTGVVVNEVLSHSDSPLLDSIELLNTTVADIDIGGWYLSDSDNNLLKYQIPAGTILPAGGYLVFTETQFNPTPQTPLANHFSLSGAHGDDVWLVKPSGGAFPLLVDEVEFAAAASGESFGRYPNGAGPLYPMASRTLGAANSGPRVGPVVISELMYNPASGDDALEFVELRNTSGSAVNLSGWKLSSSIDYAFGNVTLAPFATLVVVNFDPTLPTSATKLATFRSVYGISAAVPLVGPYEGLLNNAGERVRLQRPDAPPPGEPAFIPYLLVDEVTYGDSSPWPVAADGTGPALARANQNIYGNDPANWTAAAASPGIVAAQVALRHVFYNNSQFDGNEAAANEADDNALAPDKTALLPGGVANLANYSNYSRGINGVMLDVQNLASIGLGDFEFRQGNTSTPANWAAAPQPTSINVRRGAGVGGTDRVTLVWADGAVKNTWLQVVVHAGAGGLAAGDTFYFGNAVAEAGNQAGNAAVNASDELLARNNPRTFLDPAPITFAYDFNRDSLVNATDQIIARSNATTLATALSLITAPAAAMNSASAAVSLAVDGQPTTAVAAGPVNSDNHNQAAAEDITKNTAAGADAVYAAYYADLQASAGDRLQLRARRAANDAVWTDEIFEAIGRTEL